LGTAFTYQGRLQDGSGAANGPYDFRFALFDDATAGSQIGPAITRDDVAVDAGLFMVSLDFGPAFEGSARWLEIAVRPGASGGAYTPLAARQELTPTPNAAFAAAAAALAANPADCAAGVAAGVTADGRAEGCIEATNLNVASALVRRDGGGSFQANTVIGDLAGNASTATALATDPADCTGVASGIDASGTAQGCIAVGSASVGNTLVRRDGAGSFTAGGVTALSFIYQVPNTRFVAVPAVAFQPRDTVTTSYRFAGAAGAEIRYIAPSSSGQELLAPVYVPSGALLQNLACQVYDNSATHAVSVYLIGQNFGAGNVILVSAQADTSGPGANTSLQTLTAAAGSFLVDASQMAFGINVILPPACGADCGIALCRVEYRVLTPD
jgi:hypothetical protein